MVIYGVISATATIILCLIGERTAQSSAPLVLSLIFQMSGRYSLWRKPVATSEPGYKLHRMPLIKLRRRLCAQVCLDLGWH